MLTDKEKMIIEITRKNANLATAEGKSEIEQYLAVDEWERAYEILILELIEMNVKPKDFDKGLWKKVLIDFEIDKVGHDHEIMAKFEKWADS